MLKKVLNTVKKVKSSSKPKYIAYCDLPIDAKTVLLEGGQGSNINGNAFAMLKELCENPRWADYKTVFTVTDATLEKAKSRLAFYGFNNVTVVVRDSKPYLKYLATAKYLITDNTFPPYFNKRKEQVYLNTWHGTPLKTLGKSNKASLSSLANVQKNYLSCDYALFPNEYTEKVFMKDYDLAPLFKNTAVIGNYPRNAVFYDSASGEIMKEKIGLKGKRVFAYMPTWRDADTPKQKERQLKKTEEILDAFDSLLDSSQVLLVNLHFLLSSEIDCKKYKHIEYFPTEYETYEVLNACDGLVTDYSSVFFDFAVTHKKIILFAYDKDEYLDGRGLYMPFEKLPFPIVDTPQKAVELFESETEDYSDFIAEYCPNGSSETCENIFELLVKGESDVFEKRKNSTANDGVTFVYGGNLSGNCCGVLKSLVNKNPDGKYVVAYRRALTADKKETLENLGENVSVYGILTAYQFTFKELFAYLFFVLSGVVTKTLRGFFKRENERLFPQINPSAVIDFTRNSGISAGILSAFKCEKYFVRHGGFYSGKISRTARKLETEPKFKCIDNSETENRDALSCEDENEKIALLKSSSRMNNKLPLYYNRGNKLKIFSKFSLKTPVDIALSECSVVIGDKEYKPHFYAKTEKARFFKGFYSLEVAVEDLLHLPSKTPVELCWRYNGLSVCCPVSYFSPLRKMFVGLRGPMNVCKSENSVAIFRQSLENELMVYVRSVNVTDGFRERFKQLLAFVFSYLWRSEKARKLVILYEKNASKYEESASVLYEKLIDSGYKNAYFIVDKNYEFIDRIPEKYRKNIIYKYSFKHYLYFFKTKTFIGTEAIAHAIDLKTFNFFALFKVASKNINYVFLQHGVMYMVSLDSESRDVFKRKQLNGKYRVVVSSKAEAEHFVTLGKHLEEDIYVSGLPKFDRNVLNADADKIVIMPTWRPWEINTAHSDFSQTCYFKMLMKLYENVPDSLKEKVVILPHPLIANELSKASVDVAGKIVLNARYDDVLKQARVLITDYSSIAYDAFYRGTRVIFYWEEKDYCMEQYGPSTKLMLNENNVFGDFFYSDCGLSQAVKSNYDNPQKDEYKERYAKLVEFCDGKNTERLIEFLKKDNII